MCVDVFYDDQVAQYLMLTLYQWAICYVVCNVLRFMASILCSYWCVVGMIVTGNRQRQVEIERLNWLLNHLLLWRSSCKLRYYYVLHLQFHSIQFNLLYLKCDLLNFIFCLKASYVIYPYLSLNQLFLSKILIYNWESLGPFLLTLINNLKV